MTALCVQVLLPQDRLVCKLLLEVARGKSSPWYPYIKVGPKYDLVSDAVFAVTVDGLLL